MISPNALVTTYLSASVMASFQAFSIATDVHVREEREHGRFGSFADDDREAVVQGLDGHSLLEGGKILGVGDAGSRSQQPRRHDTRSDDRSEHVDSPGEGQRGHAT